VGIVIQWKTASEIDNAGFHLWRSDARDGGYRRITAVLIPAEGGPARGVDYEYEDNDVAPGRTYHYKLEDMDGQGLSTFHGPVSATVRDAAAIPALSQWGAIVLSLSLGTRAVLALRRRRLR
jgi:exosortase sorting signal-containing protein